jgi:hypothetical protein
MTTQQLESRVAALEADVEFLKHELDRTQAAAAVTRSLDQINRGEGIPARDAIEGLRKKYIVPAQ